MTMFAKLLALSRGWIQMPLLLQYFEIKHVNVRDGRGETNEQTCSSLMSKILHQNLQVVLYS